MSIKSSFIFNCSCANGGRVQQIRQLHRGTHVRNRPIQSLSACCLLLNCSCFFRLLEPLLWDYRKDLWWVPLTSLLQLGLRCAFLSARTAEYFTYAVELCSPNATYKQFDKQRLFANLQLVLKGKIPSAPDGVDALDQGAINSWKNQLENGPNCVATVVTNTVSSFAQVKASFKRKQFPSQLPVQMNVSVRYNGPSTVIQFFCILRTKVNPLN